MQKIEMNDLKHNNETEWTNDSTVYLEYDKTTEKSSNSMFYASNTKEIRAALQKLHEKLLQLKYDRDLAEKSLENVRKRQYKALNHTFSRSFEDATHECDAIKEKLENILQNTRLETEMEPNFESVSSTKPKSGVKIIKISPSERFGTQKPRETVEKKKKRTPKDQFLIKPARFVSSGVSSQTYSLTANMQTLINVLTLQNPRLAIETDSFVIIDEILAILQRYLSDMISVIRETICFIMLKWLKTDKMIRDTVLNDDTSLLRLKIKTLKMKRENMKAHYDEVIKLQEQVIRLQKRRKGLKEVETSKPKLKQKKRVSERIPNIAKDINIELLRCLKRFLLLLQL